MDTVGRVETLAKEEASASRHNNPRNHCILNLMDLFLIKSMRIV